MKPLSDKYFSPELGFSFHPRRRSKGQGKQKPHVIIRPQDADTYRDLYNAVKRSKVFSGYWEVHLFFTLKEYKFNYSKVGKLLWISRKPLQRVNDYIENDIPHYNKIYDLAKKSLLFRSYWDMHIFLALYEMGFDFSKTAKRLGINRYAVSRIAFDIAKELFRLGTGQNI